jgi:hypothetical protein
LQFHRKDRQEREEHRKDHHFLEPSHHRAEKPQIAQINADSIAPSGQGFSGKYGYGFRPQSSRKLMEIYGLWPNQDKILSRIQEFGAVAPQ